MRERIKHNMLIPYVSSAFIALSLFLQPLSDFLIGYRDILLSDSILLTDYVEVGGIGPALFNSGTLMLLSYIIVRRLDLRITGSLFAGIFIIGGFAFFGKNIINVLIIFAGVFLYAKYRKISLKSVIVVFLFSTGLSPISSVIMFGVGMPYIYSIPLGILLGVFSGFVLVELSSHVITFHRGYNLYNVGFSSGIVTFAFFSIFKMTGIHFTTHMIYTNEQHLLLLYIYIAVCVTYLIAGLFLNQKPLKEYLDLLKLSGRAVTDFTRRGNQGMTMINVGLTGLAALVVILAIGVHMNGPVIGGLLTIVGFSAFGKHLRNALPPMIGVFLVTLLFNVELSVPVVLAILFSTALAPIAGEHGFIIGILAGMLHLPVVTSLSQLHGGVLLYSNGFAAAFTAVIITTTISTFRKRESS